MYEKIDKIISFYKFIQIDNLDNIRDTIFQSMRDLSILGTIILAKEGINVNICGASKNISAAKKYFSKKIDLTDTHYNESFIEDRVFTKLKVKIKKEIIKAGFEISKSIVAKNTSLDPREWDALLKRKPVIIDMRNRFEYSLGTFNNSENLGLINFSDLKVQLNNAKDIDKERDIAIFCTGGIRCEKAAVTLRECGFKNIFQLKGGIINYIENGDQKSEWQGSCFVFDDRISI